MSDDDSHCLLALIQKALCLSPMAIPTMLTMPTMLTILTIPDSIVALQLRALDERLAARRVTLHVDEAARQVQYGRGTLASDSKHTRSIEVVEEVEEHD